jgi:hypothetical protein
MGEVSETDKAARAAEQQALAAKRARKASIVRRLVADGAGLDAAVMYADLFLEYSEASDNIERHGVIVQHPRTMNPIENPYLSRRDKSRAELLRLRVSADWLWSAGASDGTDGGEHG